MKIIFDLSTTKDYNNPMALTELIQDYMMIAKSLNLIVVESSGDKSYYTINNGVITPIKETELTEYEKEKYSNRVITASTQSGALSSSSSEIQSDSFSEQEEKTPSPKET